MSQLPPSLQRINKASIDFTSTLRAGWYEKGKINPAKAESVADHSFSMAIMGLVYKPEVTEKRRFIEKILLHDFPEVMTGDHIPGTPEHSNGRPKEVAAMKFLFEGLKSGPYFLEVEQEFCTNKKQRNKIDNLIRQHDKTEPAVYAAIYQALGFGDASGLSIFFPYCFKDSIWRPELRKIADEVQATLGTNFDHPQEPVPNRDHITSRSSFADLWIYTMAPKLTRSSFSIEKPPIKHKEEAFAPGQYTVAEQAYRTALIGAVLAREEPTRVSGIDVTTALELALIGGLVHADPSTLPDKANKDLSNILQGLGPEGQRVQDLINTYRQGASSEMAYIKEVEKMIHLLSKF